MNNYAICLELVDLVTCYCEPGENRDRDVLENIMRFQCFILRLFQILLEHLVHIDGVAFLHGLSLLLAALTGSLGHGILCT